MFLFPLCSTYEAPVLNIGFDPADLELSNVELFSSFTRVNWPHLQESDVEFVIYFDAYTYDPQADPARKSVIDYGFGGRFYLLDGLFSQPSASFCFVGMEALPISVLEFTGVSPEDDWPTRRDVFKEHRFDSLRRYEPLPGFLVGDVIDSASVTFLTRDERLAYVGEKAFALETSPFVRS